MKKMDYLFFGVILAAAIIAWTVMSCTWDYLMIIILAAAVAAGVLLLEKYKV